MIDQVADGSADAVKSPDHQGVAGADLVQELIELRSGFESTGSSVSEDAITAGRGERIVLELCVLVAGRGPGIPEKVSHGSKCINTRETVVLSRHSL